MLAFSTLVEILPFDGRASAEYGMVRAALEKAGAPIGALDTLIAAHAKSLDMTLVTNNFNLISVFRLRERCTDRREYQRQKHFSAWREAAGT